VRLPCSPSFEISKRAGERLHEILFARTEPPSPIGIEGIVAVRPIYPSLDVTRSWLAAQEQGLLRGDRSVVLASCATRSRISAAKCLSSGERRTAGRVPALLDEGSHPFRICRHFPALDQLKPRPSSMRPSNSWADLGCPVRRFDPQHQAGTACRQLVQLGPAAQLEEETRPMRLWVACPWETVPAAARALVNCSCASLVTPPATTPGPGLDGSRPRQVEPRKMTAVRKMAAARRAGGDAASHYHSVTQRKY